MVANNNIRIVLITTNTLDNAKDIARALVSEKIAACVNIISGINSIYEWKGTIEEDTEFLLIVKTLSNNLEILEKRIREIHPYEVPEILSIPIESLSESYNNWLINAVRNII